MEKIFISQLSITELEGLIRNCVKAELESHIPASPAQADDDLLTVREACQYLRISSVSLRKRRKNGLQTYYVNSRPRFKKSDLVASLEAPKMRGRVKVTET